MHGAWCVSLGTKGGGVAGKGKEEECVCVQGAGGAERVCYILFTAQ